MNKKVFHAIVLLTVSAVLFAVYSRSEGIRSRDPIFIKGFASIEEVSLDGLISGSDLIIVGKVNMTIPSRWNTTDGKLPESVSVTNINSDYTIFTDQLFMPSRVIKGGDVGLVRIRHFGGQVEEDIMTISGEVSLDRDKSYLLFLIVDTLGTTAEIDQGHYIVMGSIQGAYKIDGEKAISYRDEWLLADLIAHIEKSLSGELSAPTESIPLPTETILPPTEAPVITDTPTLTP